MQIAQIEVRDVQPPPRLMKSVVSGAAGSNETDLLTPAQRRSRLMARVRQRDTEPELAVRRLAHALGYRFRLQRRDLPGRPDLVFPAKRKAIFVHGCFWHSHPGCVLATVPKTRVEYWEPKLAANRERDRRVEEALFRAGWEVAVIWECETRSPADLAERLRRYLDGAAEVADDPESPPAEGPR